MYVDKTKPLDLGANHQPSDAAPQTNKEKRKNKKNNCNIADVNDITTLKEMLKQTISRGQKQRIKKKIIKITNPELEKK